MLYPLRFRPLYKERVWGGNKIPGLPSRRVPQEKSIGESWELSGLPGDISVVTNGPLKGNNLEELVEVYMGDLVGEAVYEKYGVLFPLLFKIIDTKECLSVQVHPDDKLAEELHNSYGKTEMWYIMDAGDESFIYLGLREHLTEEQLRKAMEEDRLTDHMNKLKVKKGDAFFINAGTVHCIGEGIMIAEIQQASDITYRIYDWDRSGIDGEPRELHKELALRAIDRSAAQCYDITPAGDGVVPMLDSVYFSINMLDIENGTIERDYTGIDTFRVLLCVEGDVNVVTVHGKETLRTGNLLLVPALVESVELSGKGKILETYIKS